MALKQTVLDRPRQLAARRWIFQLHLWAGVLTALYVIVASVSGSLLMLHDLAIPAGPRADTTRGERPVSADVAVRALAEALSGFRVASLVPPEEKGGAYGGFMLGRGEFAFAEIHPVTGQVSRLVTRQNSAWRFVEDLHNNLLSGRTGRVVNGVGGLSVALLCLTGVLIWWPGRAGWRRALHVDWGARWPRRFWDLHGAIGIWLVLVTFLIAVTGVYHTWPQWFRGSVAALFPVSGPEPTLQFPEAEREPRAPVEDLLAAARTAAPQKRVRALQLPANPMQPVRAVMMREGERVQAFADSVVLHPATAQVVRVDRYADRPIGDRVIRWIGVLHGGHFAGAMSETVWFFSGLLMAALAATGLAVWWNRVARVRLRRFRLSTDAESLTETAASS